MLKILLVEDDIKHCNEYKQHTDTIPEIQMSVSNGYDDGLRYAQIFLPDIVIADLELHESDGDGIMLIKTLRNIALDIIPYIIVITHNPSVMTYNFVRTCGADYVFPKSKPDYSPKLVIDYAYQYYRAILLEHVRGNQTIKPPKTLRLEICARIEPIGITDDMDGRNYIIDAIEIVIKSAQTDLNLYKHVYPEIARKYGKSDLSIEKGIENAITKAWRITDLERLAEYYTAVVSYQKGCPTNKEFIFHIANKIKGECGA